MKKKLIFKKKIPTSIGVYIFLVKKKSTKIILLGRKELFKQFLKVLLKPYKRKIFNVNSVNFVKFQTKNYSKIKISY